MFTAIETEHLMALYLRDSFFAETTKLQALHYGINLRIIQGKLPASRNHLVKCIHGQVAQVSILLRDLLSQATRDSENHRYEFEIQTNQVTWLFKMTQLSLQKVTYVSACRFLVVARHKWASPLPFISKSMKLTAIQPKRIHTAPKP